MAVKINVVLYMCSVQETRSFQTYLDPEKYRLSLLSDVFALLCGPFLVSLTEFKLLIGGPSAEDCGMPEDEPISFPVLLSDEGIEDGVKQ